MDNMGMPSCLRISVDIKTWTGSSHPFSQSSRCHFRSREKYQLTSFMDSNHGYSKSRPTSQNEKRPAEPWHKQVSSAHSIAGNCSCVVIPSMPSGNAPKAMYLTRLL